MKYNGDIQLGGKVMVGNDTIFCAHTGKWQLASFSFLIKTSSLYTHRSLKQTKCTHFTCISHTPSQACKSGHERTASSYTSIILSLFYYFFTVLRGRKSQQKTNNQTGQSAEMSQIPKAVNRKYMY